MDGELRTQLTTFVSIIKEMMTLDDFTYSTINLAPSYEGEEIATLIAAKANQGNRSPILYIHGYSDYFFHPHVAEEFLLHGFDFYALDLRKYGRSILPHQHAGYCNYIEEYFEEIDIAVYEIFKESKHHVTLLAHSFGGLVAAMYLNKGLKRKYIDKLILNAPFLAFNTSNATKELIFKFLSNGLAKLKPYSGLENTVLPFYVRSLHKNFNGEWNFNLNWKPVNGFKTYFAWIHAVDNAQKYLKQHSKIEVPILVLCSASSYLPKKESLIIKSTDIILDTHELMHLSGYLGEDVMIKAIKHAVHDVFLSRQSIREQAFHAVFEWEKIK